MPDNASSAPGIPEDYPMDSLFPPHLGPGAQGPAVLVLRMLAAPLVPTRISLTNPVYDEELANAIKLIQRCDLGFVESDANGDLNSLTRERLLGFCEVDVEAIKANHFGVDLGPTMWSWPGQTDLQPWPLPTEALSARVDALDFRSVGIDGWKVRVEGGLIYNIERIPTFRDYLRRNQFTVHDQLSHDGVHWTPIREIPDLEQHFIRTWQAAKAAKQAQAKDPIADPEA